MKVLPTVIFMKPYASGTVLSNDKNEQCILKQGRDWDPNTNPQEWYYICSCIANTQGDNKIRNTVWATEKPGSMSCRYCYLLGRAGHLQWDLCETALWHSCSSRGRAHTDCSARDILKNNHFPASPFLMFPSSPGYSPFSILQWR